MSRFFFLIRVFFFAALSFPLYATDLVFYSGSNVISTSTTADNSFWVGVNAPNVSATVNSGVSVTVSVAGSSTTVGGYYPSSSNILTINGSLISAYELYVGYEGSSNSLIIGSSGTATSSSLYFGTQQNSSNNSLSLSGSLTISQDAVIGQSLGANQNQATISGAQGNLSLTSGTLYVGRSGSSNSLRIESAGTLASLNGRIGGGTSAVGAPSNNSVYVDGTGSSWNLTGTLRVGSGVSGGSDTQSSLEITGGGAVSVSGDSFVGYSPTSTNNRILVDGSNSILTVHDLTIGGSSLVSRSSSNTVTASNGGTLSSTTTIYIPSSNNLVIESGGTLSAHDLVSAGVVEIGAVNSSATISGDYIQAGGTYRARINTVSQHASLNVTGNADISSGTVLDVAVADCSLISPGATITGLIVSANPITYSSATTADNCPSLDFVAVLSSDSRSLNLVSTTPAPPQPIPTLSEWAQIMMMLMMIATAGFYGWRIKPR